MNNKNRKKIWYVPGIISLILLIFPFSFYINREFRSLYAIKVYIADTVRFESNKNKNTEGDEWERSSIFKPQLPKRNYADIVLTGHESYDQAKLAFAQVRIREILATNDSINGLRFVFTDSSKYKAFVKAINILMIEQAKIYVPFDNYLWFYTIPPVVSNAEELGDILACGFIPIEPYKSPWMQIKAATTVIWNSSWQMIVLFPAFLASIFIIKRNRSRRKRMAATKQ